MALILLVYLVNLSYSLIETPEKVNQLDRIVISIAYLLVGIAFFVIFMRLYNEMKEFIDVPNIRIAKKNVSLHLYAFMLSILLDINSHCDV